MPNSRFRLSGFADEVDGDVVVQAQTFARLKIDAADVRSAFGKNVMALSDDELREVKRIFADQGVEIQAVGSPLNKVKATPQTRAAELDKAKRAVEIAHTLGVRRIRVFTPEVGSDEHASRAGEVLDWMAEQIAVAQAGDAVFIHENDAVYWGAFPANAKLLFDRLAGPHFRAAFDFANTVLIGFRSMDHWFPWLLPHLDTLHIKDAIESERKVVAAGEGEGQLAQTIAWLIGQRWNGPLTLEPHLQAAGALGGFSGPELFAYATDRLRAVLDEAEAKA